MSFGRDIIWKDSQSKCMEALSEKVRLWLLFALQDLT
jgi:hypothetical protein